MKYLAALTALGLLTTTAAYAQQSTSQDQQPAATSSTPSASPSSSAAQPELAPSLVRQIHLHLKQQVMYDGPINGQWDDQTAEALTNFQQENNLQSNGQIDVQTLAALLSQGPGMRLGMQQMMRPQAMRGSAGTSQAPPGPLTQGQGQASQDGALFRANEFRAYERGFQNGFRAALEAIQQQQQQE